MSFGGVTEDGTGGFYLFGSQRVAYGVNPSVHNSSIFIYIPTPGLSPTLRGALATTLRLTVLF